MCREKKRDFNFMTSHNGQVVRRLLAYKVKWVHQIKVLMHSLHTKGTRKGMNQ